MEEPDPATIRLAAGGDLDAFAELVRTTQPHVWRFIRHLVHDDELAADLTQDTYLRVHRALGSFRGDSRFRTWLFRIARNVAIDDRRRAARRDHVRWIDRDGAAEAGVADSGAPASGPALQVELQMAIDELPERQRSAFVLVEVFGLKYREVAEILDISTGTVKSRVFHARARLVQWFDGDSGRDAGERRDHG